MRKEDKEKKKKEGKRVERREMTNGGKDKEGEREREKQRERQRMEEKKFLWDHTFSCVFLVTVNFGVNFIFIFKLTSSLEGNIKIKSLLHVFHKNNLILHCTF